MTECNRTCGVEQENPYVRGFVTSWMYSRCTEHA